jgi:hypothetical protein
MAKDKVSETFEHYWEYAKLWRTWVIGVAAAAMFVLLNKDIGVTFPCRAKIAALFVLAAGLQVVLAWINKTAAYYGYRTGLNKQIGEKDSWWCTTWLWVEQQYWIDFIIDAASLALVGWAVVTMIASICGQPTAAVTTLVAP